tara:strand:- start:1698 stop:2795 length:1098 start_codon:yes stop_codon:yes gene_type:complete
MEKKLLFFMPFIGGGGVEKNLFIIANYFSKKISNIYILSSSDKYKFKFDKNINFISPKKNINENVNIKLKYLISLCYLFLFLIKNRQTVVFSFQANIYAIILCKLLGIKIIARSNSSPEGWYHNWIKKFIYSKIINLADLVIVNSNIFKIQMEKKFGIKPKCIFNPLDKKQIILKSKSKIKKIPFKKGELKILNIGRLTDQKDQITLVKMAKILNSKKIKFKLIIMGRGIERDNLTKEINNQKLNNFVRLIPFQHNPYPYIKKCDLFVLSSKYEGLPNVLLEAALLNKFIISTNCPTGPKEILLNGKGGLLFKIGDYKDLARKIIYFKKNKIDSKKIKKINYSNLSRFDYLTNLEKYYKSITSFL